VRGGRRLIVVVIVVGVGSLRVRGARGKQQREQQ